MSTGPVLVTGGAGFVGRRLVARLLSSGADVRVLDLRPPHVEVASYLGDVRDPQLVEQAVAGVRTIFHLAARTGVRASVEAAADVIDVNARGTALLLDAAERAGVRKVVLASSLAVFGDTSRHPKARAGLDQARLPTSPYGASKLAAEGLMSAFAATSSARCAVVRLSNVYGPHAGTDQVIGHFLDGLGRGRPLSLFGDGTSRRDYLHVDDAVRELQQGAAEAARRRPAVRHGATGHSTSLRELIDLLQQVTGRQAELDVLPPQPGDPHTVLASPSPLPGAERVALREGLEDLCSS